MVDENIPKMTVRALSARGDDLLEIRGTECEGLPEDQVWQICQDQKRLFISTERGFSKARESNHKGRMIVCLKQPIGQGIHQSVLPAFHQDPEEEWQW